MSSQRYTSLPATQPVDSGSRVRLSRRAAGGAASAADADDESEDEELLELEEVRPDDDEEDVDEDAEDGDVHGVEDAVDVSSLSLHVQVPSAAAELDRDSSLSSRHSESHPFDQDVRHLEHRDMQRLHGQQPTPTNRQQQLHQLQPSDARTLVQPINSGAQRAADAALGLAEAAVRSTADVQPSDPSAHLSVPGPGSVSGSVGGLRKSLSIGDKLAGRARELAVAQGKRLDAIVRGIEAEPEYVEVKHKSHSRTQPLS